MQYMKQFYILLLTCTLITAQDSEDKFFTSNETLEAKISFTPKTLKKSIVDSVYFDTNFAFKIDNSFQDMEIGIFLANFFIKVSSFFEKPVVPIITLFFNFEAIFKISIVHLGTVKSIITFVFLKASILLVVGLIPEIFLFIILFSVKEINLKFLFLLEDLMSC